MNNSDILNSTSSNSSIESTLSHHEKCGLFVIGHKPFPYPIGPEYFPIAVGNNKFWITDQILSDETGDNISQKNASYCEMTAVYWIWKNISTQFDNIGIFHYSRYLCTSMDGGPHILTSDVVSILLDKYDFILPPKYQLPLTAKELYCSTSGLQKDLEIMEQVILSHCPNYHSAWKNRITASTGHYCNIFVTTSDHFQQFCQWVFPLLEEAENQIDTTGYTPDQLRVIGYLSEFMIDVWIEKNNLSFVETRLYMP